MGTIMQSQIACCWVIPPIWGPTHGPFKKHTPGLLKGPKKKKKKKLSRQQGESENKKGFVLTTSVRD
jgi:hypothetical protein